MAAEFIGAGLGFPVRIDPTGSMTLVSDHAEIRESIRLILGTAYGERPMRPEFGCGIHDLVFQSNTAGLRGLVAAEVRDALTRWEPRVDVLDVRVESPEDARNQVVISIACRIRENNAALNLVYPFFLDEGVGVGGGRRAG